MTYRYRIKAIPPSNNKFIGRNAQWEYQKVKKEWADLVRFSCRPYPKQPIDKSVVQITYCFPTKVRHDPDNYSGKMILDGLTSAGIIADDSFSHIALMLRAKVDKQNPHTEITITEVDDLCTTE